MKDNYPEWSLSRLNDIAEISGGSTPSTSNPEYWDGDIPFVTPTDITSLRNTNYIEKTERTITEKGLKAVSRDLLPSGTILLTSRATLGEVAINKVPVVTNQGFANLRVKAGIDEKWLLYWLCSQKRELERLASGSTFREVSKSSIKRMKVPVPPLVEQRGIAEVLGTVDEAIRLTDQVIERTEELKRGLMQQLLTQGIGHTEFKDTPLGPIPKTWKNTKLNNVVDIIDCKHYTPNYLNQGIPIIRTNDIKPSFLNFDGVNYVSEKDYNDLVSRHKPAKGDIVYSREGTFGVASYVNTKDKFCIGQRVVILHSKNVNSLFLFFALNSNIVYNQVLKSSLGTTARRINVEDIKSLLIPLPSNIEQIKIAEILCIIEKIKQIEIIKINDLKRCKSGLMQVLLSGERRVELNGDGLHRLN